MSGELLLSHGLAFVGVLAALLVLAAYWGLETGRIKTDDPRYYWMNGISSAILVVSIGSQYDMGDLGAIMMETCWLGISLKGLWRTQKARKKMPCHS